MPATVEQLLLSNKNRNNFLKVQTKINRWSKRGSVAPASGSRHSVFKRMEAMDPRKKLPKLTYSNPAKEKKLNVGKTVLAALGGGLIYTGARWAYDVYDEKFDTSTKLGLSQNVSNFIVSSTAIGLGDFVVDALHDIAPPMESMADKAISLGVKPAITAAALIGIQAATLDPVDPNNGYNVKDMGFDAVVGIGAHLGAENLVSFVQTGGLSGLE